MLYKFHSREFYQHLMALDAEYTVQSLYLAFSAFEG